MIEIINESGMEKGRDVVRHTLYVDGAAKASVVMLGGMPQLNWQVYGPQSWPDARELLQGLLELSILADSMMPARPEEAVA